MNRNTQKENLVALPNTQSDIVAMLRVGDLVSILDDKSGYPSFFKLTQDFVMASSDFRPADFPCFSTSMIAGIKMWHFGNESEFINDWCHVLERLSPGTPCPQCGLKDCVCK